MSAKSNAIFRRLLASGAPALAAAMLLACAKPQDLVSARAILFEARKARAEQCAPDKFRDAELAINLAEKSNDITDAYVARRNAEAALAAAQSGCLEGAYANLSARRDRLASLRGKVDQSTAAAEMEKLRRELEATKTISAEEEGRLRDEVDKLKDELEKTKTDKDVKGEALAKAQKQLAEKEQALAKAMAEKETSEKKLIEAMQKIVTIKKESRGLVAYLSDILFDFDRASLRPGAEQKIADVAKLIAKYPYKQILIEGHADNIGPDAYNLELSKRRAETVRQAMIGTGIPAGRVESKGFGKSRPMVSNDTPEGRQRNRRVEVVIN